jgi:1,4-dihydroxy-6-naphthoate synthase
LVAIPGRHTTAHLLFSLAYPNAKNKVFLRYDEIENFVLRGKGMGVIIHENRFTYAQKGLHKITDLGDYWETKTGYSIPLGGIVAKRAINNTVKKQVDGLVRQSIEFAFSNYPVLPQYVRNHAQEMSEEVMRKHINLYVNEYSLDLGMDGKKAIEQLLNIYQYDSDKTIHTGKDIFLS